MRSAIAGLTGVLASGALAGVVVLGTQLTGGAAAPGSDTETPAPGKLHASEVHAWVACKDDGEKACAEPTPPGLAKKDGAAPGPASKHGHGYAWGRAHAPGQLKTKDHDRGHDEDESDEPESD